MHLKAAKIITAWIVIDRWNTEKAKNNNEKLFPHHISKATYPSYDFIGYTLANEKKLNSNVEKISSCHKKTNSQSNSWKLMTKKWACNTIFCRGLYVWVLENFRVIKLGMCTLFVWYTTTIENFYLDEQSNYTHAQFTLELIINKGLDIRSEYLR